MAIRWSDSPNPMTPVLKGFDLCFDMTVIFGFSLSLYFFLTVDVNGSPAGGALRRPCVAHCACYAALIANYGTRTKPTMVSALQLRGGWRRSGPLSPTIDSGCGFVRRNLLLNICECINFSFNFILCVFTVTLD
jgi:hypothetical protein